MKTYIIFNQFDEEKIRLSHQLIRELVRRGNIVIYYSALKYKQQIKKLGAEFREYPVVCKPYFQDQQLSRLTRDKEQINVHQQIALRLVDEVSVEKPSCLIYDSDCLFAKMLAIQTKVPSVCIVASYVLTEEQLREVDETSQNNLQKLKQYVSGIIQKIESVSLKSESEVCFEQDEFSELNLVCTNKVFQPYATLLDETFDYVGYPIDYQTTVVQSMDFASLTPPFTYVSMTQKTLLSKTLLQQLSDIKGTVIIDLESFEILEGFGELPKSIKLIDYKLSENDWDFLDLLISDGGLNLTNIALKHNVPLLLFPKTEMQGLIAARIEECLLGIWGNESDEMQLKQSLDLLLYYERFKANTGLFASSFSEVGSGRKMVYKIEQFLRNHA